MDPVEQSSNAAEPAIAHGAEALSQNLPLSESLVGALFKAGSSQPSSGAWQPPSPEELQRQIPQYEIRGILGRGGMGVVYKGWQKSLQRFVAIKILPGGIEDGGMAFAERFKQEARAMAKFRHPGIVAVHDAGETPEGLLYFVMECIDGKDVAQLVAERGRLQPAEALRIASRVCEAVAYAHARGVIHRDIKPSNVMIEADGAVKVADFGLAKLSSADSTVNTLSSVQIGTLDFMPPEALHGSGNADHRADIYAVGGMLYQMLTGKTPHGRFEPPSVAVPGLDKRFDAIVDKAMHADAAKRHSSAAELQADLARIAGTEEAIGSDDRRGSKPLLAIFLATAAVCIAAILFAQWKKNHTGSPPGSHDVQADTEGAEPEVPPIAAIPHDWANAFSDLSKLPGIAEFKDGWARLSDKGGIKHIAGPDGGIFTIHSGGIRAQRRIPEGWHGGILLHARSLEGGRRLNLCYYEPKAPGEKAYLQLRQFEPESLPPNATVKQAWAAQKLLAEERIPPVSGEITTDLIIIGGTVRGHLGDHSITATVEDDAKAGRLALDEADTLFFRDVAVLNLDTMTEAEALEFAGMKTDPARWQDAFAAPPLREIIAKAEHTEQGYRLPKNNHWPISPPAQGSGAARIRATCTGERFASLYIAHEDRRVERVRFRNSEWLLSHGMLVGSEAQIAAKGGWSPLDQKPHELILARIGGRLRVMLDGESLLDEADPNPTPGSFVLDIFGDATVFVEMVEYLALDGVPEAEALKRIGVGVTGK